MQTSPPLNPPQARNTDSCLPPHPGGEVEHKYLVDGPAPGKLWFRWAHGSIPAAKNTDPRVQTMRYNEDTIVLRENICVDWRGPFTYLLFGNRGALLLDTGATPNAAWYPLRDTVGGLIAQWGSIRRKRDLPEFPDLPLTIALTSGECAAQTGGLSQFAGRPRTTVVPRAFSAMKSFYRFGGAWPAGSAHIDLGGRVIDVLPTPGTHRDGLTFYDRYTQILFTGDLLFPGKIVIANEREYLASLQRLQQWKIKHPVKWVMGGHIDMQFLPGKAYDRLATFKPYERELQMEPTQIDVAVDAATAVAGRKTVLVRSDFWMLNGVGPDAEPDEFPKNLPDLRGPRPV